MSNQVMIVANNCLTVSNVIVSDVGWFTVSSPASNCWRNSRSDAKIYASSPPLVGVKLNNCWVPFWWLIASEGIITPPSRDINQWSEFIHTSRIFSVQNILLAYVGMGTHGQKYDQSYFGKPIQGCEYFISLCHIRLMRSIKFIGFWYYLSWKVLAKLHSSFQPNPESELPFDIDH